MKFHLVTPYTMAYIHSQICFAPSMWRKIHLLDESEEKTLCGRKNLDAWDFGESAELDKIDRGNLCRRCYLAATRITTNCS